MDNKPITRMRTNRGDINRIFGMYAGLQELETASKEMEKRFRLIPNGWRDLKCIISQLNKLMDNIVATIPPEKLVSMHRMLPRMRFKVVCGDQASVAGYDECTITLREADVLCKYAHEHCKMCFEGSCSNCPLGRTLDSVLMYDRDGRSWASVDIQVLTRKERDGK